MPHWTEGRPWLVFDREKNKMFCTWCTEKKVSECKFVSGTDNFKLFAVKQHEASKYHKHFAPKYQFNQSVTLTVLEQKSDAHQCLEMLQKADYDRLTIKLRTVHAVAKHHKSFRDYNFICRLDAAKGLDIGNQYQSDKAGHPLSRVLQTLQGMILLKKLQKPSSLALLVVAAQILLEKSRTFFFYIRVCTNGIIDDIFFHIGSPESTCAKDIHDYISGVLQSLGLDEAFPNKLVGFCADGASNMQGKYPHFMHDFKIKLTWLFDM
jgi:hypothetical protein